VILNFICGCTHEIHTADLEDLGWWKEVGTDKQGFLVCVTHNARRKSWNSLPEGASKQMADWSRASWTPLQREQYEVFGRLPIERSHTFDFSKPDRRDNRDPEKIGKAILAQAEAKGNGNQRRHSEISDSGEFGA
jgi:hypothetical protein